MYRAAPLGFRRVTARTAPESDGQRRFRESGGCHAGRYPQPDQSHHIPRQSCCGGDENPTPLRIIYKVRAVTMPPAAIAIWACVCFIEMWGVGYLVVGVMQVVQRRKQQPTTGEELP